MRTYACLIVAVFVFPAAALPAAEKTEATELKALQGEWVGAKLFTGDYERSAVDASQFQATFKKKDFALKWTFRMDGGAVEGTTKLNPSTTPGEFDGSYIDSRDGKKRVFKGAYEIRDGELILAFPMDRDGTRPATLEPTKNEQVFVVHFKKKMKEKRR